MQRRRSAPHTFEENIAAEKSKLEAQVAKLKAQGLGATAIAKEMGIGRASVYRALGGKKQGATFAAKPPGPSSPRETLGLARRPNRERGSQTTMITFTPTETIGTNRGRSSTPCP